MYDVKQVVLSGKKMEYLEKSKDLETSSNNRHITDLRVTNLT
jgi:hypothetical protein